MADRGEELAADVGEQNNRRGVKRPSQDDVEQEVEGQGPPDAKKGRNSGSDGDEETTSTLAIRKDSIEIYRTRERNGIIEYCIRSVEDLDGLPFEMFRPYSHFEKLQERLEKTFKCEAVFIPKPPVVEGMSVDDQCKTLQGYMNQLLQNDSVRIDDDVIRFLFTPRELSSDKRREAAETARQNEESDFVSHVFDLAKAFGYTVSGIQLKANQEKSDSFGKSHKDYLKMLRRFCKDGYDPIQRRLHTAIKNARNSDNKTEERKKLLRKYSDRFLYYAKWKKWDDEQKLFDDNQRKPQTDPLLNAFRQYAHDITEAKILYENHADLTIKTQIADIHYHHIDSPGKPKYDDKIKKAEVEKKKKVLKDFDDGLEKEMARITVAKFKTFLGSVFEYGRNELTFSREELMEMFASSQPEASPATPPIDVPGPSDAPEPADNPVDDEEHQLAEKLNKSF